MLQPLPNPPSSIRWQRLSPPMGDSCIHRLRAVKGTQKQTVFTWGDTGSAANTLKRCCITAGLQVHRRICRPQLPSPCPKVPGKKVRAMGQQWLRPGYETIMFLGWPWWLWWIQFPKHCMFSFKQGQVSQGHYGQSVSWIDSWTNPPFGVKMSMKGGIYST